MRPRVPTREIHTAHRRPRDRSSWPRAYRHGNFASRFATRDLFGHPVHPDCRDAVEHAAKLCAGLGHEVEEGSPAADYRSISRAFDPIWRSGHAIIIGQAARASKGRPPLRKELQGLVWAVYEAGLNVKAIAYQDAWNTLHAASRKIAEWHRQYDIWLTPTLAEPPWKIGFFNTSTSDLRNFRPMATYASFTPIQNMSGQPAVNLPLHWSDAGLPIGVQFVGRFGEEELLLQLAAQLEQAQLWAHRRPPIWS